MKNFKFHWGHGLALALLSFMIFIVSFLVRFQLQQGNSMDLVTEDYYNHGLQFENEFQALQNVKTLEEIPSIKVEDKQLVIHFPENIEPKEGRVKIYRPSNKIMDKNFPLTLNNHEMRLNEKTFEEGKYNISVSWKNQEGKDFIIKKEIIWK